TSTRARKPMASVYSLRAEPSGGELPSAREVPLLRLELLLADLAPGIALAQDVQGGVGARALGLREQPAQAEDERDEDGDPEGRDQQHDAEAPDTPHAPHGVPAPLVHALLDAGGAPPRASPLDQPEHAMHHEHLLPQPPPRGLRRLTGAALAC